MGMFPFSKGGINEKTQDSPQSAQEDAVGYVSQDGSADEPVDDLHRGMKPRQLSTFYCDSRLVDHHITDWEAT